jgi:drug/metabolite transporter (DMT)-like permease
MIAPLLIRCMSGLLAFFCTGTAIKNLPIVLVSLFQNTLPLFTSLLGFLILREQISKSEIICLFLAFFGVFVLLYDTDSDENGNDSETQTQNIDAWSVFMCIMGPMLNATTNICLRHMRGLHEYTASTYSVLFSLIVYAILIMFTEEQITVGQTFVSYEFLILAFVAIAGGFGMLFKTKALQYEMAGRLGMLLYLSIIFTFLFDLFLIGT